MPLPGMLLDGVPGNVSHVAFKFQRGQKLAETEPVPVSEQTGSAQWQDNKLHQVVYPPCFLRGDLKAR